MKKTYLFVFGEQMVGAHALMQENVIRALKVTLNWLLHHFYSFAL
jgi:hypothetical protein